MLLVLTGVFFSCGVAFTIIPPPLWLLFSSASLLFGWTSLSRMNGPLDEKVKGESRIVLVTVQGEERGKGKGVLRKREFGGKWKIRCFSRIEVFILILSEQSCCRCRCECSVKCVSWRRQETGGGEYLRVWLGIAPCSFTFMGNRSGHGSHSKQSAGMVRVQRRRLHLGDDHPVTPCELYTRP